MSVEVDPAEQPAKDYAGASPLEAAAWFFENAQDLFAVVGPDGRFQTVNPAWRQVMGWELDELIGRRMLDLVHEDSLDEVIAMGRAMVADGATPMHMRLRRRDGGWAWLEGHARRGPNGEVMGMLRDVTDERARAEQLEHARQVESRLQETAGVGLWSYDPLTDALTWSDEWRAMFAEAGVEVTTVDEFRAVCHPDDIEGVIAAVDHVIEQGGACAFDHRFQAADGRWIWIHANVWAKCDAEGRPTVYGISQVVTELAEALNAVTVAQHAAEARNQRLRVALRAAKAAVIDVDFEARTVWTSPEYEALVGRPLTFREAASPVWSFIHPDDRDRVHAAVMAWAAGGPMDPIDALIIGVGGRRIWARFFLEIETDFDGSWRRAVVLMMDIDEAKRQELALVEAERGAQMAAEAKSQFLANMSHEIRTPMNGVLGVLHLLKGEGLSGEAQTMVDEALACGQMLQALLDDVVDFSKIEAGRLELAAEPADPGVIVEGVVAMLAPQAQAKGLSLRLETEALPAWVITDPVRLRQCLFNLIGNAVKFTSAGAVTVRAWSKPSPQGARLAFRIEDSGIGISEAAQARLFRRFQQADATTTRRFGGSGLGLAITRRLVELMGGEIGVVSREGQGSTFWFEVLAPETDAPSRQVEAAEGFLQGVRVLVVEDNPTNRMIVTKMIEGLGGLAETAENGERGVVAALAGAFDLILMDIQMPGIDGIEATRQIRASATPAAATPIIALTANVLRHQREAYLAAGVDGVVGKPVSPAALMAEIARVACAETVPEALAS